MRQGDRLVSQDKHTEDALSSDVLSSCRPLPYLAHVPEVLQGDRKFVRERERVPVVSAAASQHVGATRDHEREEEPA